MKYNLGEHILKQFTWIQIKMSLRVKEIKQDDSMRSEAETSYQSYI